MELARRRWFAEQRLRNPVTALVAAGCRVEVEVQGAGDDVLLVHGLRAHLAWWDGVVDGLKGDFRLIRSDLSGHGRSGRRRSYGGATWAEELGEVLDHFESRRYSVVGHSMGGLVSLALAAHRPSQVERVVLVDTRIRDPRTPGTRTPFRASAATSRRFASVDDGVAAFRVRPEQPPLPAEVMTTLATRALEPVGDEWRWAFDPGVGRRFSVDEVAEYLAAITCPVHYVYGTRSSIGGPESVAIGSRLAGQALTAHAMDSHHHVPLEEPVALAAHLREVLLPSSS
jgi:pimeloyl-ACP methyl ester carboxylesterase